MSILRYIVDKVFNIRKDQLSPKQQSYQNFLSLFGILIKFYNTIDLICKLIPFKKNVLNQIIQVGRITAAQFGARPHQKFKIFTLINSKNIYIFFAFSKLQTTSFKLFFASHNFCPEFRHWISRPNLAHCVIRSDNFHK